MANARADIEKLHTTLKEMGERAAADPSYRESLRTDQVGQLAAAGVSVLSLSGALTEFGADEEEVAAYGMTLMASGGDPDPIIVSSTCIGTCKKQTYWVCVNGGCKVSTLGSGPINPQP